MIQFVLEPAQLLQLLASTIFPLLIGLITTRDTDPNRRAVLLAGLAVLTSLAAELAAALQTGAAYDLAGALLNGLMSFLIAVGMHFGLWKTTSLPGKLQAIGSGPAESGVWEYADTPQAGAVSVQLTNRGGDQAPPALYPAEDPDEHAGPRHAAARPGTDPRDPRH